MKNTSPFQRGLSIRFVLAAVWAAETASAGSPNLLPHSSFETGARQWAIYERMNFNRCLDAECAWHGRSSLRFDLPSIFHGVYAPAGRLRNTLATGLIKLKPDLPHVFSVYARSTAPDTTIALRVLGSYVDEKYTPVATITAPVTGQWSRVALAFRTTRVPHDSFVLLADMQSKGNGTVWMDAAQLEEGAAPTEYQPKEEVCVGAHTRNEANVFLESEPLELHLVAANHSQRKKPIELSCRILDLQEQAVWSEPLAFDLASASNKEIKLCPNLNRTGAFKLEIYLANQPVEKQEELVFVVVPSPRTDVAAFDSSVGAHVPLREPDLRVARRMGVRWIRLLDSSHATFWTFVEPQKDRWQWADDEIKRAKDMGFEILGALYAPAISPKHWFYDAARKPAHFAVNLQEWEQYVFETVRHYRPWIQYWGVWNEPGGATGEAAASYADLARSAIAAMKRADPAAQTVAPDAFPAHRQGVQDIMVNNNILKLLDVFSIHYFTSGEVSTARDWARRDGKPRPLWVTEDDMVGLKAPWYSFIKPHFSDPYRRNSDGSRPARRPLDAAVSYIKNYVTYLAGGVGKVFYYWNTWDTTSLSSYIQTGTFEYDGAANSLYAAQAVSAALLDGAKPVGTLDLGSGSVAHLFARNGQTIACLWSAPGSEQPLRLDPKIQAHDFMGNRIDAPSASLLPVYLTTSLAPNALKRILAEMGTVALSAAVREQDGQPVLCIEVQNQRAIECSGALRIDDLSAGWRVAPPPQAVAVPAGESRSYCLPITRIPEGSVPFSGSVALKSGRGQQTRSFSFPILVAKRDAAATVAINRKEQVKIGADAWRGEADCSASVAASWDNATLRVSVRVTDDLLVQNNRTYLDDCVELFFNTNLSDPNPLYGEDDFQVLFAPVFDQRTEKTVELSPTSGRSLTSEHIRYASTAGANGYTIAAEIDWRRLGFEPRPGRMIGFDVAVDDADEARTRKAQIIWAGEANNHVNTARFGYLILK